MTRRLFLGVELNDEVRHGLAAMVGAMDADLPGKPVPPRNWHLTLRFVGEATAVESDIIVGRLALNANPPAFSIRLDGLGGFPSARKASVLFISVVEGAQALAELASVCELAVVDAGFPEEDRPFHAHLTLSRLRPPRDVAPLVRRFGSHGLRQEVRAISLFASHLGRGGARYEVLERVDLPT